MTDEQLQDFLSDSDTNIIFYTPVGLEIGFNYTTSSSSGWVTVTIKDYERYMKKNLMSGASLHGMAGRQTERFRRSLPGPFCFSGIFTEETYFPMAFAAPLWYNHKSIS